MSWVQGWVTLLGWQAAMASAASLVATLIQGLVVFNITSYEPQRWHATLIMVLLAIYAGLMNTVGKKLLPVFETLAGIFHV
jgi:choline transport protein